MDHELYKEWLHLSVYGELDDDKRAMLDAHVQSCEDCRREHDELVEMLTTISESRAGEPTEEALAAARQRLSTALWSEPAAGADPRRSAGRESFLARWFGTGRARFGGAGRTGGWLSGYRVALAGAATLVVGFFAGYLAFGDEAPVTPPRHDIIAAEDIPAGEQFFSDVSNVQFLNADAEEGEIELQYDEVRPMRLKAGMDDARVRKLLAHAILTGDNPGIRLQAINFLETSGMDSPNEEVKQALIGALVSDPNAGVRRRAFLALQRLPFDKEIRETLMFVLEHDDNPGIRVAAMDYLTAAILEGDDSETAYFDILDSHRR